MHRVRPSIVAAFAVLAALPLLVGATLTDDQGPITGLPTDEATPLTIDAPRVIAQGTPDAELALTPVGDFIAPVEVTASPSGATFVVEVVGHLRALDGTIALDLTDRVLVNGEQGLLGAAFHPTQPFVYAHYTNANGESVVAEFGIDEPSGAIDASTHRVVFVIEQPFENHNGGELDFGPDGLLYVGLGDGGLANDPHRLALDLTSPLGKILRVDPLVTSESAYSIPTDNPFVGVDGADERVWSFGLRNPWKFSFDAETGDLWIADVGQDHFEEINRATATDGLDAGRGTSFGWSAFEGHHRFNEDQADTDHTAPFAVTDHAGGNCSISGGVVVRDPNLPSLSGWYVYGDYCTGVISAFDASTAPEEGDVVVLGRVEALTAVAAGADGAIYATSAAGTVFHLTGS